MFGFGKKRTNAEVMEVTETHQQADTYMNAAIKAINSMRNGFKGAFNTSPNGKRDYNALFGYGVTLAYADYRAMYKRGGIASVVVAKVAKACWRDMPQLKVGDTETLSNELLELKNAGLFKALEKADILNRIGKFSVLLIGVPDGQDLDKPVGSAGTGNFSGLYFNVYNEEGVTIVQYDNDPASPRYDLPLMYQLQTRVMADSVLTKQARSVLVHHSRIVHLAEGSLESPLEGVSSLEQPWNALIDKEKVRGSSAEAYYRNARQKLSLETEKGFQVADDGGKLKTQVEDFQNGLQDTLRLNGMKANMLQPSMASPRDPFDVCVEEIAGTTGIPVRLLTTKAGGTVTGAEDKASWNAVINDRQDQECTGYLIDSLRIMSSAGMINLPDTVEVEWNPQASLNEKEAAEVVKLKAEAFKAVTEGLSTIGADDVVAKSVFAAIGMDDVEVTDLDFDDEITNKPKVV